MIMNKFCKNLISNGVPSWVVEDAYKFALKPLKGAEDLVGAERESAELYRNAIIASYIEGASATLLKVQRYYGGEEHS